MFQVSATTTVETTEQLFVFQTGNEKLAPYGMCFLSGGGGSFATQRAAVVSIDPTVKTPPRHYRLTIVTYKIYLTHLHISATLLYCTAHCTTLEASFQLGLSRLV